MKELERENRSDTCGWQCRGDGQRMDVALVQNSQHDVNSNNGSQEQPALVSEGITERGSRALKARGDALGHANLASGVLNLLHSVAQGRIRSKIEGDGGRWELALMIEHE